MDSVSIRVPYRNLKQSPEVELIAIDGHDHPHHNQDSGMGSDQSRPSSPPRQPMPLAALVLSCTVAAGVQFGWALQLSLLTPYIQTLGIDHAFTSFIWLCGPITGLVVQPCVGIWSDKCTSKYGRRRPFILLGSLMISVAVIIIGFSADIGYLLGDTKEHCSTFKGTRTRAALVFIIGFWMLDLANNTVQGPARALLADLSGPDQRNSANAIFCTWMAVGNILGFSAGASGDWHRWFPFLESRACCAACGNLKAAFIVAVIFLNFCTLVTLYFAKEVPLTPQQHYYLPDSAPLLNDSHHMVFDLSNSQPDTNAANSNLPNKSVNNKGVDRNLKSSDLITEQEQSENFSDSPGAVLVNLLTSLRHLPPAMYSVLIVMALTWVNMHYNALIFMRCLVMLGLATYARNFSLYKHGRSQFPLRFILSREIFRLIWPTMYGFSRGLSWFPFFLFDTDWMGKEVYHGNPNGTTSEVQAYDQGVREGAFGLLLNSVVLGISSFFIEPMCKWIGARLVWALCNFIVFVCMGCTAVISLISVRDYSRGIQHVIGANQSTKIASLVVFTILGFPLAITYSVPFSVTAELTADSGGGQGLAIGVLNLAIVIPQMIISLGAGPWDELFGGGNIPAFILASIAALAAGVIATLKLPHLSNSSFKSSGFHFG